MTNNNNHHSNALASFQQSDPTIEQILVSSGHVPTVQRVDSGGDPARLPRINPLDADSSGISRVSAHQPARQTGEWRIDRPTHKDSSLPSHIHNGTTAGRRPDTVTNHQISGEPNSRGVPIDPDNSHSPQTLIEQPLAGVRQDKDRNSCDRVASLQPAAVNKFTRSQATSRKSARSKKEGSYNH